MEAAEICDSVQRRRSRLDEFQWQRLDDDQTSGNQHAEVHSGAQSREGLRRESRSARGCPLVKANRGGQWRVQWGLATP